MPLTRAERVRPLIVGEDNPYGGDDEYALYPHPEGCSGHRLCCLILGMGRSRYLREFDRCNLVQGKWSIARARERVADLHRECLSLGWDRRFILLGSRVCSAWGIPFRPFEQWCTGTVLILPHPSGRNLMWNEPGAFTRTRSAVLEFAPHLVILGNAQEYAS